MPVAAVGAIGAGTSLLGGIIGSSAASAAARAQQRAGQNAINEVNADKSAALGTANDVWRGIEDRANPYLQTGTAALGDLGRSVFNPNADAETVLAQDPGYQFRLDEGQKALARAQAASGGLGGGGALKAALKYGQDYASGEYQNAYGRYAQGNQQRYSQLMGLAGIGQNASQLLAGAGDSYANLNANVDMNAARMNSDNITGIGNAQAAGEMGSANAWSNALSGIGGAAMGAYGLSQMGGMQAPRGFNDLMAQRLTSLPRDTMLNGFNPQIVGNGSGYGS